MRCQRAMAPAHWRPRLRIAVLILRAFVKTSTLDSYASLGDTGDFALTRPTMREDIESFSER